MSTLPIIPFDFVAYAFTLLWDNLSWSSCISITFSLCLIIVPTVLIVLVDHELGLLGRGKCVAHSVIFWPSKWPFCFSNNYAQITWNCSQQGWRETRTRASKIFLGNNRDGEWRKRNEDECSLSAPYNEDCNAA